MNPQIQRILETSSYDQLEQLEGIAYAEGRHRLAAAIDAELKKRRKDVVDSIWNIIETIESLELDDTEDDK